MLMDRHKVFLISYRDFNDIAQEAQNLLVSGTLPVVNGRKNDLYTSMQILLAPVVQIKHFYEGHPRAYNAWPMVCHSPYQDGRIVMYSPIGYDGKYYTPPHGELVEGDKLKNLESGLFAGGWSDPAYIFIPRMSAQIFPLITHLKPRYIVFLIPAFNSLIGATSFLKNEKILEYLIF